jgi:hypothetical protein
MIRNIIAVFIAVLLNRFHSNSQTKTPYDWYHSQSNGGLCNQSILLFADSTYCSESGCESSSHFSFGKWRMKKDTILFMPADLKEYKVIARVKTAKTSDKKITVILYDNQGVNITERIAATQYIKNLGFYAMDLDSSKTRRSDARRANGSIVLKALQRVFQQKIEIPIDSSSLYEVYLNLSNEWNFHSNSDWMDMSATRLLKRKDKLVSVRPDQIDEKGVLKPSEFIKQEN